MVAVLIWPLQFNLYGIVVPQTKFECRQLYYRQWYGFKLCSTNLGRGYNSLWVKTCHSFVTLTKLGRFSKFFQARLSSRAHCMQSNDVQFGTGDRVVTCRNLIGDLTTPNMAATSNKTDQRRRVTYSIIKQRNRLLQTDRKNEGVVTFGGIFCDSIGNKYQVSK